MNCGSCAGSETCGGGGKANICGGGCPKPAGQICHEFFALDNSSRHNVLYVNEFDPSQNWSSTVSGTNLYSPHSLEIVSNAAGKAGRALLLSVENGYVEVDPDNKGAVLVRVAFAEAGTNVSGASRLPDGNTALGNLANITIVTPAGRKVVDLPLVSGTSLRTIRRQTSTGNFLYTLSPTTCPGCFSIYEMSPSGAPLWSASLGAGAKGYSGWWRDGGGVYATTGESARVVTIDSTGAIIASIIGTTATDGAGNTPPVDFFAGFMRVPNGDFVVANWLGHASGQALGDVAQLIEYAPNNKVVWTYGTKAWATQTVDVLVIR